MQDVFICDIVSFCLMFNWLEIVIFFSPASFFSIIMEISLCINTDNISGCVWRETENNVLSPPISTIDNGGPIHLYFISVLLTV